jgi:hypothetical protein
MRWKRYCLKNTGMVDFTSLLQPVLVTSVRIVFYIYEFQYWYIILVRLPGLFLHYLIISLVSI